MDPQGYERQLQRLHAVRSGRDNQATQNALRRLAAAARAPTVNLMEPIIEAVNGVPAKTLDDVRAGFDKPLNGFHIIELSAGQGPRRIVLDAAEVDEAEPRIRKNYGIEHDITFDVLLT